MTTEPRIILHAGMPKAGSSSIQNWMAKEETKSFLGGAGFVPCVVEGDAGGLRVIPHESGPMNSGSIIRDYVADKRERGALVAAFAGGLAAAAQALGRIIVSSEAFAQPFWRGDDDMLVGLESVAERYPMRVAYYARPQHTALEAAWRQWGFRSEHPPTKYILLRSRQMHYDQTLETARRRSPSIDFVVRPFRRDLLVDGGVVPDFTARILELQPEGVDEPDVWTNRGLPLPVVNALRLAPAGRLWSGWHDNWALNKTKQLLESVELEDPPEIETSRRVLQAYCRDAFEPGNLKMISEFGWHTEHFVPPVDPALDVPPIEALDDLWRPKASAAELDFLYAVLEVAIGRPRRSIGPDEEQVSDGGDDAGPDPRGEEE